MEVRYDHFSKAWIKYFEVLKELASLPTVKKICEIGGGANPALPLDFVEKHGLEYTILDISVEELEKAPSGYKKLQGDIASSSFSLDGQYDLVFSMQLAEHIKSGHDFHKNVLNLLNDSGYAFHFFPTLYTLPFVMNRLLPQNLSSIILIFNDPSRKKEGNRGKFPAYYSWCKGPLESQIKSFENLGYCVEKYVGFFGHNYYVKIKPLKVISSMITSVLLKYPIPLLTSYAYILLRKNCRHS
jgi:uncharacterized UPF0146 family protein